MPERSFNTLLLFIFAVLALIGVTHHEIWSDEAHHWLIARDSSSLPELNANLRYDGHPILWNFLLFLITRFTGNPLAMQLLNAGLAIAAMGIFLFYSPFSKIQKGLFILGYFTLYEFTCISRNYTLLFLFLVIALALFQRRGQQPMAYHLTLAFLANTHFLGTLLAISLFVVGLSGVRKREDRIRTFSGLAISLGGIVLAFLQVIPPGDSKMVNNWLTAISPGNIYDSFFLLTKAFVPIPTFTQDHFWNHFLIMDLHKPVLLALTLILSVIPVYLFLKDKTSLIFFYLAAGAIGSFLAISRLSGTRYFGIVFLAMIAAQWIKLRSEEEGSPPQRDFRGIMITVLLFIQMTGGVIAWQQDLNRPFSESKNLARYITESGLSGLPLLADNCLRAPVICYLQTQAYFLSSGSFGSFCRWNQMGFPTTYLPEEELLLRAKQFSAQKGQKALLITNKVIKGETGTQVKQLRVFNHSIIETENFFLYLVSQ